MKNLFKIFCTILLVITANTSLAKTIQFTSSWMDDNPFAYKEGKELTGIDIDILKAVAANIGYKINFTQKKWGQGLTDLISGKQDIVIAASFSEKRNEFAYFTAPYRGEENSLLILKPFAQKLNFKNGEQLIEEIKAHKIKFGVIIGSVYVDPAINNYITNHKVAAFTDINSLIVALKKNKIEGVILSSATAKGFAYKSEGKFVEMPLEGRIDQHFMLSKKTVTETEVEKFNIAIKELVGSDEYNQIINKHIN